MYYLVMTLTDEFYDDVKAGLMLNAVIRKDMLSVVISKAILSL